MSMSIYNRSYMREDPLRSAGRPWALKTLLITIFAVFVLQNIFRHWLGSAFLETHFALNLELLSKGWIHSLLTYGFLHSTDGALPWHILFNCLMLYWFGREVESRFGSERLFELFLLSVFTGGIIWTSLHFLTGQAYILVGASSGLFGILYLFCRMRWLMTMEFLFLPVRFTGQQLFYVLLGFQAFFLLFGELPGNAGSTTAYSAHLGGILGAFLYERYLLHRPTLISLFRSSSGPEVRQPKWERKAAAVKAKTGNSYKVNVSSPSDLKQEVDRILDKINEQGFGALSPEEKKTLDKAKDLL